MRAIRPAAARVTLRERREHERHPAYVLRRPSQEFQRPKQIRVQTAPMVTLLLEELEHLRLR
jgi:predicted DNA-binding protein (UPF0251 family)